VHVSVEGPDVMRLEQFGWVFDGAPPHMIAACSTGEIHVEGRDLSELREKIEAAVRNALEAILRRESRLLEM
jgi:hypothetical protein